MTEKEFLEAVSSFLVPLRMLEGPNEKEYEKFNAALSKLAESHKTSNMISKSLALELVNIYPLLLGVACGYEGKEKDIIEDWAIDVMDKITDVLT